MSEKKEKKKVVKKRRPKSKNYFTQDTEDAIVRYNNSDDPELKSKIYGDEIHYPFFKLLLFGSGLDNSFLNINISLYASIVFCRILSH